MSKNAIKNFGIGVKNSVNGSPLELHFLDSIHNRFDWETWDYTNMVAETINKVKAENPSKILLVINSGGGDCNIGLSIYNFLKSTNAEIETHIVGIAGSIASVIALAASNVKIAKNAFMVIHQAWGGGVGQANDLRQAADVIDKYTNTIVDIYASKTGKTTEEIHSLIANGDYWMNGSEAVEAGFCDGFIDNNTNFQIAACISNLNSEYYKNIPQNIVAPKESQNSIFASFKNDFSTFKNNVMEILNGIKTAFAGVKKPENTPEQNSLVDAIEAALTPTFSAIQESINGIEAKLPQEDLSAQLKTANDTIAKLQEDLSNLVGGPASGGSNTNNGIQPIGSFE